MFDPLVLPQTASSRAIRKMFESKAAVDHTNPSKIEGDAGR
jgi:hypothetical protein